ncbi:MAG TPA: TfoX/Sxy family protein [Sphaerochaetaceae bacterium]|jgi:DNA transformation protein|nr:TfoX/Sxy family protein [Sphaerochaetaceae bacterium]
MSELLQLPNVGKVLERHLLAVGIETPTQLKRIGAENAFLMIRSQRDPDACLHMLYGLQGAILGIPDAQLPDETKTALQHYYANLCAATAPKS